MGGPETERAQRAQGAIELRQVEVACDDRALALAPERQRAVHLCDRTRQAVHDLEVDRKLREIDEFLSVLRCEQAREFALRQAVLEQNLT